MQLDRLSPNEVVRLELATGVPVVYTMSRDGEVVAKEIRELKAPAAVPGAGIREGS